MNDRTDKLLMWIDDADAETLRIAERRLLKAQGIARRLRAAKWVRIASVRRAILNAEIAKHARLDGAIHQALGHERACEYYAHEAFAN